MGNTGDGVLIANGANSNSIGDGTGLGANVVSGNGGDGIHIDGSGLVGRVGTENNVIIDNLIGTSVTGNAALGNKGDGVLIENGANSNTIGAETSVNVISANQNGIHISGPGTTGNSILGNYIGQNISGSGALGNAGNGILIDGAASANLIGDDTTGGGNIVSGNGGNGIYISGTGIVAARAGTTGNIVVGNLIGTDSSGSTGSANKGDGILIDDGANANKIGDGTISGANTISSNGGNGIQIDGSNLTVPKGKVGTSNNVIFGDMIGVDISGSNAWGTRETASSSTMAGVTIRLVRRSATT